MKASNADTKPEEVVVECAIETPRETLWRALSEEDLAADWLGARPASEKEQTTKAKDQPRFSIVEAHPFRWLRYAWHDPASPDAPPLVTVELEPMADGRTWFRLTHGWPASGMRATRAANTNTRPLAHAA